VHLADDLVVPKVEKIRGLNLHGTPRATSASRGIFYFTLLYFTLLYIVEFVGLFLMRC
jgi:hypothetical protein